MAAAWEHAGKTTGELLDAAEALLARLRKLVEGRRNKDAAFVTLTDSYLMFQAVGERLQGMEFGSGPIKLEEEEEEFERADPAALADLFAPPDEDTRQRMKYLQRGMCEECAARAEELQGDLHDLVVRDFNTSLDIMVRGARNVEEVTKRVLAVVRRVNPGLLKKHFGLSQADISRRLGETRATTQAREKRVVEEPLKKAGANGFKLAGGARSEAHRSKCAKAQKGNTSRREGELRKRNRN